MYGTTCALSSYPRSSTSAHSVSLPPPPPPTLPPKQPLTARPSSRGPRAALRVRAAERQLLRRARAVARDRVHVVRHRPQRHRHRAHLRAHLLCEPAVRTRARRRRRRRVQERDGDHRRVGAAVHALGRRVPRLVRARALDTIAGPGWWGNLTKWWVQVVE